MALDPLAATSDLPSVWQDNEDADRALAVASAAIRDAAGCPISTVTATVTTNATPVNLLHLPGPVTEVTEVTYDGDTIVADDYEVLPNGLWRHCGWGRTPVPVSVTCTFGLADVPDDIVDLCCQLAVAWLEHRAAGGGSTAGLVAVSIDDAREQYTDEHAGQVSPVYIPKVTRDWLRARFSGGAFVVESL